MVQRPTTVNYDGLLEAFDDGHFDVLVAASGENVLYLSGMPVTSVLGFDRIALVLWEPASDPAFVVCDIDEGLAREESWIADVRAYREFRETPIEILARLIAERGLEKSRIGIEAKFLTAAQARELSHRLPNAKLVPCDHALDSVRVIKTEGEVRLLQEAGYLAEEAIHFGFGQARAGMSERDVLSAMNAVAVERGGVPSGPILGSGLNTTHAHPEAGAKPLEPGDLVRVDFCGLYEGYWFDVARTAVVGEPTAEQCDIYARLFRVQRKTIDCMRPGVLACDVFDAAIQACEDEGLPLGMPHVGHSLGIGIHENPLMQPRDRTPLQPNMVICIEPVYVVPGVGGYHVEDLVRITGQGSEILTDRYDPSELWVIAA